MVKLNDASISPAWMLIAIQTKKRRVEYNRRDPWWILRRIIVSVSPNGSGKTFESWIIESSAKTSTHACDRGHQVLDNQVERGKDVWPSVVSEAADMPRMSGKKQKVLFGWGNYALNVKWGLSRLPVSAMGRSLWVECDIELDAGAASVFIDNVECTGARKSMEYWVTEDIDGYERCSWPSWTARFVKWSRRAKKDAITFCTLTYSTRSENSYIFAQWMPRSPWSVQEERAYKDRELLVVSPWAHHSSRTVNRFDYWNRRPWDSSLTHSVSSQRLRVRDNTPTSSNHCLVG